MKTKSLVLLAMALGCGFVAMLGVQQIMSGEKEKPKDLVSVLIARQEIEPGVRLETSQVSFENLPREAVPAGAVSALGRPLLQTFSPSAFQSFSPSFPAFTRQNRAVWPTAPTKTQPTRLVIWPMNFARVGRSAPTKRSFTSSRPVSNRPISA